MHHVHSTIRPKLIAQEQWEDLWANESMKPLLPHALVAPKLRAEFDPAKLTHLSRDTGTSTCTPFKKKNALIPQRYHLHRCVEALLQSFYRSQLVLVQCQYVFSVFNEILKISKPNLSDLLARSDTTVTPSFVVSLHIVSSHAPDTTANNLNPNSIRVPTYPPSPFLNPIHLPSSSSCKLP